MMEIAATYEMLYCDETPPCDVLKPPPDITYVQIQDDPPNDDEVLRHVQKLKNGKAPGALGLRPEDLKLWAKQYLAEDGDK